MTTVSNQLSGDEQKTTPTPYLPRFDPMPDNSNDSRPNTVWGYHFGRANAMDVEFRVGQPFGPKGVGLGVFDLLEELPLAADDVLLAVLQVLYRAHLKIIEITTENRCVLIKISGGGRGNFGSVLIFEEDERLLTFSFVD